MQHNPPQSRHSGSRSAPAALCLVWTAPDGQGQIITLRAWSCELTAPRVNFGVDTCAASISDDLRGQMFEPGPRRLRRGGQPPHFAGLSPVPPERKTRHRPRAEESAACRFRRQWGLMSPVGIFDRFGRSPVLVISGHKRTFGRVPGPCRLIPQKSRSPCLVEIDYSLI